MKTKVMCDSSCYMTKSTLEKYQIDMVSLYVNFEDISFKEMPEDHNIDKILKIIDKEKKLPTTSQPSPQNFLDAFLEQKEKGYDRIIFMAISSKLSGTFQGAKSAAEIFMQENPEVIVDVFDTNCVVQGSAVIIQEVCQAIHDDPKFTNEKIQKLIDWMVNNVQILLTVEKLDYLIYGGRVNRAVGAIGNILGFHPIVQIADGEIKEYGKVRSRKKALKKIVAAFEENVQDERKFKVINAHLKDKSGYEVLKKEMLAKYSDKIEFEEGGELGPVVGIHVGPGCVGMGWYPLVSLSEKLK